MKSTYICCLISCIISACATKPIIGNRFAYDIYQYQNLTESNLKIFTNHINEINKIKTQDSINYSVLSINQYQEFVEEMETESLYTNYTYAYEMCTIQANRTLVDSINNQCSYSNLSMTLNATQLTQNDIVFNIQPPNNKSFTINMNLENEYLIYYFKTSESLNDLYIVNRNWVLRPWDYYYLSPQQ